MLQLSLEDRRKCIGHFYSANHSSGKAYTVNHFKAMGISCKSIYNILKRVDERLPLQRKCGSGRRAVKMSNSKTKRLISQVDRKSGILQRHLAKSFKISQSYVCKILKSQGVKYRKRQDAPDCSEKQAKIQKTRLRLLGRGPLKPSNEVDVVMDDESYFYLSGHNTPANAGYYASDDILVDSSVKYKRKSKFPGKLMLWLAISPKGHSAPYFMPRNCSITGKVYSKECISKRLEPF